MNRIIHILKYKFDPEYRKKHDNKMRFAKIMQVNKTILN